MVPTSNKLTPFLDVDHFTRLLDSLIIAFIVVVATDKLAATLGFGSSLLSQQGTAAAPDKLVAEEKEEKQQQQQQRQRQRQEKEKDKQENTADQGNGIELLSKEQPLLSSDRQQQDLAYSSSASDESSVPGEQSKADSRGDDDHVCNDNTEQKDDINDNVRNNNIGSSVNDALPTAAPDEQADGDSIQPLVPLTHRRQRPRGMSTPQPMLSVSTPVRGRYFNLQSPLISSPPPVLSPSYSTTSISTTTSSGTSRIDMDLQYLRRQSRVEERIRQFETNGTLTKRRYSADCTRTTRPTPAVIQKRTFGFKPIFTEWERRIAAAAVSCSSPLAE